MEDAVDIGDDALDPGHVGEIGAIDLLPGSGCPKGGPLGQSQDRIDPLQALAQRPADASARARDQYSMHFPPPVLSDPLPGGSCHAAWSCCNRRLGWFIFCQANCQTMTPETRPEDPGRGSGTIGSKVRQRSNTENRATAAGCRQERGPKNR